MATKKRGGRAGVKRGGPKAIKLPRGRTAKAVGKAKAGGVGYAGKYSFATTKAGSAILGGAG